MEQHFRPSLALTKATLEQHMRLTISNYIVIALVTGLIACGGSSSDNVEKPADKISGENVSDEITSS